MVLTLEDEIFIDVDKISAVVPASKYIVIDGTKVTILKDKHMASIVNAYIYTHKSYMQNEKLKKIRWVRGK